MRFEIVKYRFDVVDGKPKIIIEMIKQTDADGKYVKFISMKDALPLLAKYPVMFRDYD